MKKIMVSTLSEGRERQGRTLVEIMRSLSGTRICNRYSFIIEKELLFSFEGRMVEEVFYWWGMLVCPKGLQLWESKKI